MAHGVLNLQYTLLLLILCLSYYPLWQIHPFTIHFATINTAGNGFINLDVEIFTIHFATINTAVKTLWRNWGTAFTIHFATINTI